MPKRSCTRCWAIPVEYQVDGLTQMQVDERHGLQMHTVLKTSLRLDPAYILIGEIRDEASARVATGRVVPSTLHARDAAGTVTSLRNLGAANHEIATAPTFVTAQRLVRKLCVACAKKGSVEAQDRKWLERLKLDIPESVWNANGCPRCAGTGSFGRTGVFELWPLDQQPYELILAGADEAAIRRHARSQDASALLKSGMRKVEDGLTTLSELRNACAGNTDSL
jgi:type II secretory ATPase GspE/PulE/Tfp pilus assembly ATPase PilB-like protein